MHDWRTSAALAGWALAAILAAAPASAQSARPVEAAATTAPVGFTSAAQARVYLSQNPSGARAEAAFRAVVAADIAARNPEIDPAQAAAGSAIQIMPGAIASPASSR